MHQQRLVGGLATLAVLLLTLLLTAGLAQAGPRPGDAAGTRGGNGDARTSRRRCGYEPSVPTDLCCQGAARATIIR